jgi:cellulose synthase/poly-beta-1,6-N-acetylglucosamine synthase-like glycosyltransferase
MRGFLYVSNGLLFIYYLVSNAIYLFLLITAVCRNTWHRHRLSSLRLERLRNSPFTPPITIIVPARNEEACIADSVQSLLTLDYANLELIVVNDGSQDNTLNVLKRTFQLRPTRLLYIPVIPTAAVRDIYTSAAEPRIVVLTKDCAGNKADAINAGLNAATSPYVCVMDADSILEPDALLRIMAGVFSGSQKVVAAGGIVRILNGCRVSAGRLRDVRLPSGKVEIMQVIEYLRAFLIGREAWAYFKALPIISGAFGIFRTDLVRKIGGFRPDAIGEDFDLVVRLHRHQREQGQDYHISFVPDPTCWTEAPSELRSLARQRARWQKGLLDTLWSNRDMLFRRRYGRIGLIILPYMWIFELLAPVIELTGYFTIGIAALVGDLGKGFFVLFLLFGYAFATLISIGSVLLEEMTFRRYSDWREVSRLLLFCLLEHFPYRQMTLLWRLQGIWQYFMGDVAWREMKRSGLSSQKGKHPTDVQISEI